MTKETKGSEIYVRFFSALKDLNGSVALSEVQIKCGICLKSYACRHTDRHLMGKSAISKRVSNVWEIDKT